MLAHVESVAAELPRRLLERSREMSPFAPAAAAAFAEAAEIAQQMLLDAADELLTLQQASEVGGYSVDHLGRMLAEEKIRNAGRKHAPRIRRGDVPVKAGYRPPAPAAAADDDVVDLDAAARAIQARGLRTGSSAAFRGRRSAP